TLVTISHFLMKMFERKSIRTEIVSDISNADIETFSPSPIPNEDSDSHMEEIDLYLNSDDPMPPGIEDDDDDSERDISILEELLDNYPHSLPDNESYHFDIPSPYRSPAKPPDGNTGTLNIKMMGDVSDQKVHIPKLTITRVLNQEKYPDLLSHLGLEAIQPSAECPMIINGKNIPLLDVPLFHFYPLDQFKYGGIRLSNVSTMSSIRTFSSLLLMTMSSTYASSMCLGSYRTQFFLRHPAPSALDDRFPPIVISWSGYAGLTNVCSVRFTLSGTFFSGWYPDCPVRLFASSLSFSIRKWWLTEWPTPFPAVYSAKNNRWCSVLFLHGSRSTCLGFPSLGEAASVLVVVGSAAVPRGLIWGLSSIWRQAVFIVKIVSPLVSSPIHPVSSLVKPVFPSADRAYRFWMPPTLPLSAASCWQTLPPTLRSRPTLSSSRPLSSALCQSIVWLALVISVESLKHALLVENLSEFHLSVDASMREVRKPPPRTPIQGLLEHMTPYRHGPLPEFAANENRLRWSSGSVVPSYNLMFAGILNYGPANSIILRVKGVFTASLKGLFRSSFPTSFLVTTVRLLVRFSSSSKVRGIGDTFPLPLCSFSSSLRAKRCPSICSLAERTVSVRGVSALTSRGPPEVDPMTPSGVIPMLSLRVPLSSPPVILMLRKDTKDLFQIKKQLLEPNMGRVWVWIGISEHPNPQITPNNTSNPDLVDVPLASDVRTVVGGNDDEFEIETLSVAHSDHDENEGEVLRPRLKQLRCGCRVEDRGFSGKVGLRSGLDSGAVVVDDDGIEDFSSSEDNNAKGKSKSLFS
nr:hypothetical protein [Tanacetum cinerariifolium]